MGFREPFTWRDCFAPRSLVRVSHQRPFAIVVQPEEREAPAPGLASALHRSGQWSWRQPSAWPVMGAAAAPLISVARGIQLTGPLQLRSLSMVGQLWAGPDSVDVRLSRAAWW